MIKHTTSLSLLLAATLAAPMALAQEATAPAAPATPAAPAAPAPAEPYVKTTEGDWKVQCIKAQDDKETCEMTQFMSDTNGNKVASISIMALPKGKEAVAGATIATPLESALTAGVTLQIDAQKAVTLPYAFCSKDACFSNVALKDKDLDLFKKGNKITMTIVPMVAPDKKVELAISLKGFSAAWDAVVQK
ncbi:invasion associated locus B family protein [Rhodobacter capsulatus]|uniref:invasion associated locus B family protein n=1 Tax=Rhodobacter capsulatus TaxID=1061 RepID=UPI0040293061